MANLTRCDAKIELTLPAPPTREAFDIEVEFPRAKIEAGIFPREHINLAEDVDVLPDRRLDE